MKSGWQLIEDGPEAYETYIVPAFSGAWARDIVGRADLRRGDRLLDLGCGTGIVARHAYRAMGDAVSITGWIQTRSYWKKPRTLPPGTA